MAGRLMLFVCGWLFAAGALQAQGLNDPTRPAAGQVPAGAGMVDPLQANSGLQSIILRKNARPAALINGVVVELGGMAGEARLVKVEEDAVVLLQRDGSRETIRLIPEAQKTTKVGAGGTAKPIGMNAEAQREEKRR